MFKVGWAEKACQLGLPRSRCLDKSGDLLGIVLEQEEVRNLWTVMRV